VNTDNSLTLPDGRKLAFAEYGQPDGRPVLYFHSAPGSRLDPLLFGEDLFCRLDLRVIAADRPGMGRSDFQPNRGFSDWPQDVVYLADTIGLERFSVLGVSGGGGYVAACAAKIPDRLCSAVIVSGGWRMDWPEARDNLRMPYSLLWTLADRAPLLLPVMLRMMSRSPKGDRGREQMPAQKPKYMPASDYAALAEPGRMDIFAQAMGEAMVQGVKGPAWDVRLYVRDWGFELSEIQMPLKVFHGEQDPNVPLAVVQRATSGVPNAQLVTYPEDGHISTSANHMDEIAQALVCE
jgi:pimeloyl-ACP methyl ester carboxylesterase